jgi:hypothetical protein
MTRREPKTIQALEVSVRFEPSHVAPTCIAQAYEQVVPIRRRVAAAPQHDDRAGRARLTQHVGGAHA